MVLKELVAMRALSKLDTYWAERQRVPFPFPWPLVALAVGALAGVAAVILGALRVLPLLEDTTVGFDAPHLKAQLRSSPDPNHSHPGRAAVRDGQGSGFGLPTNNANDRLIGIECAWPTIRANGTFDERERWPDAQIIAMRDVGAALTKQLGYGADRRVHHMGQDP
jgi:hypothetical protein